jgi:hypothetical protein
MLNQKSDETVAPAESAAPTLEEVGVPTEASGKIESEEEVVV